jgi:Fur family ferric uptake transcriptional regulator
MHKRKTKQKAAIREAFVEADRPLLPDEALESARRHHATLGIATVYRNTVLQAKLAY